MLLEHSIACTTLDLYKYLIDCQILVALVMRSDLTTWPLYAREDVLLKHKTRECACEHLDRRCVVFIVSGDG